MKKSIGLGLTMLFSCAAANAGFVTTSTNPADFVLTLEDFALTGLTAGNIVSTGGDITLVPATIGDPATTTATWTNWTASGLTGPEYALSGDENFDVLFSSAQTAFAMNYDDDSIDSIFTLTFFDGASNVGTASFTSVAPFNTGKFIGFISDTNFNKVEVRENDGSENSNEYFQFYRATAATVPTPATLALFGLGLAGLSWSRRKRV